MSELSKLVGTLLDTAARQIAAELLGHPLATEPEKAAEPFDKAGGRYSVSEVIRDRMENLRALPGHVPTLHGTGDEVWCFGCGTAYPCVPVRTTADELTRLAAQFSGTSPGFALETAGRRILIDRANAIMLRGA